MTSAWADVGGVVAVGTVPAASDGQHLWYIRSFGPGSSKFLVMHQSPDHSGGVAVEAIEVGAMVEEMLAVDSRLFLIFPAGQRGGAQSRRRRNVAEVRATYSEDLRRWIVPSRRGRTIASLPGDGSLCGVAVDGRKPMVLIRRNVEMQDAEGTADPDPPGGAGQRSAPEQEGRAVGRPELLRLERDGWVVVPLPVDLPRSPWAMRLVAGLRPILAVQLSPDALVIAADPVAAKAANPQAVLYELQADDTWTSRVIDDLPVWMLEDSAVLSNHTVISVRGATPAGLELFYLRGGSLHPIGQLEGRSDRRKLIAHRGRLSLVEQQMSAEGQKTVEALTLTNIDMLSGKVTGESITLGQMGPLDRDDFGPLLLVGSLLIATLVLFLFRPSDPAKLRVVLPEGATFAEPSRRLLATLVDLFPAGVLTKLILTDVSVFELIRPVLMQGDGGMASAFLMIGLCVAHCTISEMLWGRTLGKALVDSRVISVTGERAGPSQILIRNAMKAVAIAVPPLVLFVFMSPYRQRLGDLAARTAVIVDGPPSQTSSSSSTEQDET